MAYTLYDIPMHEQHRLADGVKAELSVIPVPKPVRGSKHGFKYSLALVVHGECILRFDNEAGKGDHFHLNGKESAYEFKSTWDRRFK